MVDNVPSNAQPSTDMQQLEREEEAKLKAKYPSVSRPGPGFLQKRLQKGQKYFDSGDYNMAKAAVNKGRLPASALSQQPAPPPAAVSSLPLPAHPMPTGDTIPSPDYLATRKSSIHVQSKLATGTS